MKNLNANKPSILIVDDSEDNRAYCEMMAEMYQADVIKARNVDEAMAILATGVQPSAVLLDLIMPGRRPEELISRVRADEKLTGTKVVVMSALRQVKEKSKKMGADAAMKKPFTMDRFVKTLGLAKIS